MKKRFLLALATLVTATLLQSAQRTTPLDQYAHFIKSDASMWTPDLVQKWLQTADTDIAKAKEKGVFKRYKKQIEDKWKTAPKHYATETILPTPTGQKAITTPGVSAQQAQTGAVAYQHGVKTTTPEQHATETILPTPAGQEIVTTPGTSAQQAQTGAVAYQQGTKGVAFDFIALNAKIDAVLNQLEKDFNIDVESQLKEITALAQQTLFGQKIHTFYRAVVHALQALKKNDQKDYDESINSINAFEPRATTSGIKDFFTITRNRLNNLATKMLIPVAGLTQRPASPTASALQQQASGLKHVTTPTPEERKRALEQQEVAKNPLSQGVTAHEKTIQQAKADAEAREKKRLEEAGGVSEEEWEKLD